MSGPTFDQVFAFGRPVPAQHRNAQGELVEAAPGQPRIDHDEAGAPLGLLIEEGPYHGAGDRLRVLAGEWEIAGPATVFHERLGADGAVERRAVYTLDARKALDGLLAGAGHHRRVGAVSGFLRNRGGYVRYREADWALPDLLGPAEGVAFTDGEPADRPLLEG